MLVVLAAGVDISGLCTKRESFELAKTSEVLLGAVEVGIEDLKVVLGVVKEALLEQASTWCGSQKLVSLPELVLGVLD